MITMLASTDSDLIYRSCSLFLFLFLFLFLSLFLILLFSLVVAVFVVAAVIVVVADVVWDPSSPASGGEVATIHKWKQRIGRMT